MGLSRASHWPRLLTFENKVFSKRVNLKDFEQASCFQLNESKVYILLDLRLLSNVVTMKHS